MDRFKDLSANLHKKIKSLADKKGRKKHKLFLVEGLKLCRELLNSEYVAKYFVVSTKANEAEIELAEKFAAIDAPVYKAKKNQYDKICDAKTPQEILAVAETRKDKINPKDNFVALDGVSDPGNVGTILRAADWFGIKQAILNKDCADLYNPKTVRSSMGSIFRMSVAETKDLASSIKSDLKNVEIYGASLSAEKNLDDIRPRKPFGIVLGNESKGVRKEIASLLNGEFKIKGAGRAESLNVSVAAGIIFHHFSKI